MGVVRLGLTGFSGQMRPNMAGLLFTLMSLVDCDRGSYTVDSNLNKFMNDANR